MCQPSENPDLQHLIKYSEITESCVLVYERVRYDIIVGDIADSEEDAIVNSTGSQIYLKIRLAESITSKAGPKLVRAVAGLRPLAEGDVVETESFNMKCIEIFHCNVTPWDSTKESEQKLKEIVISCLEKAEQRNYRSLAMPAIGAGQKGYPKDVVAHMIIQALTEYIESHPTTSLTNVRLYLFHRTDMRSEVEVFSKPFHQNLSKYSFGLKNDVTLYICKGALSNSEVDIMVNPTGSKTSLVLLKKGGQALQDECSRIKKLDVGEIAMTGAYGLPCVKIFHVNCPPWSDNVKEQSLQQIISDCLNATKDQKAKTIAFPAIGTGELNYPPEDVARCFFRTCAKFAEDNPGCGIKKILLVIDDADDGALQGYEKVTGLKIKSQTEINEIEKSLMATDLPSHWEKPHDGYREIELSPSTLEFKRISIRFKDTLGLEPSQSLILQMILRIQNPKSYFVYGIQRNHVAQMLSKQTQEVEVFPLWHSTSEKKAFRIARNNFDRGTFIVKSSKLGACCCFNTTSKAANLSKKRDGEKYMIMARVITGDYCQGHGGLRQAPCKPGSGYIHYDSVVDNVDNPTVYGVFTDFSTLPEYIIKYRIVDNQQLYSPYLTKRTH